MASDNKAIGRPMEILLIEDSMLDARLTIHALEKGGLPHRLSLMLDGREALEFLLQEGRFALAPRPDVILLDLLLPGLSGLELLEAMKGNSSLSEIPVVVLTGAEDEDTCGKVASFRVEHFIRKPVDFDQFLRVVRELKDHWHHDLILPP